MEGYELTNYKAVALLAHINEEIYEQIKHRVRIFAVAKGETIFSAGEPANSMYIIYRGSMKISAQLSDGREQILYIYKNGEFVGGLNILSGDYYAYTGVALVDTFVITITQQDFRNFLLKEEAFMLHVLDMAYERIRFSESQVDVLSTPNADQRVAKVLLHMCNRFGIETNEGITLESNLNREEMGSYAGITRETMSRKIHQFEKEGILEAYPKGDFLIKNMEALREKLL